jgi:peptidyl-dipeptidase A
MKAALDRGLADRWGLKRFAPCTGYGDPFFGVPARCRGGRHGRGVQGADTERLTRDCALRLPVDDLFALGPVRQEGKVPRLLRISTAGAMCASLNVKPDEYWMSTLLHEFGHAAYDKFIDQDLPFPLRQPAHTLSTEAIAMLMGRLTRDSVWLEQSAGVPAPEARRIKAEVARALRVGQLIFARWGLLVVHFERELYRDPERDLNALWWTMAADFQGVRPPAGRNAPDWAAKIHFSGAPVYYQNYLLGEMTASQLHHTLTRELGAPSCAGRAEAGRFLRERYFKTGALYDWNETLRRATGETLNPDYFLKQFVLTD